MNTYKWLLKPEFWEHKGGFLWAQVVVGTLIALGLTLTSLAKWAERRLTPWKESERAAVR